MGDDKTKTGRQDRSQVAAEQEYEVRDFADKFDISLAQAKRLIERHGMIAVCWSAKQES